MATANTITKAHIEALLERSTVIDSKVGHKSTLVCVILPSGFEIVESSGCVDPLNYNHELGVKICLERITNRLWALEGYRLQCTLHAREARIARAAHEVNRAYCAALGDYSQKGWEEAPQWQRDSAIAGVRFHIANPDASPSASHENWLKDKLAQGWKWGEVKDAEKKEHPCMVEFTELPQVQQAKDHLFRAVVHQMAAQV